MSIIMMGGLKDNTRQSAGFRLTKFAAVIEKKGHPASRAPLVSVS